MPTSRSAADFPTMDFNSSRTWLRLVRSTKPEMCLLPSNADHIGFIHHYTSPNIWKIRHDAPSILFLMVPAPQGSYLWTFLLQGLDMPDLRILAAHAFSLSLLFFGEGTVVESFCFANAETIIFVRLGRLISMGEQGRVYWFCLPLVFMGLLFGNLFLQFENRIVNVNFINFIGPGRWLFPWRFSLPHDTLRLIGLKHIFTVI